MLDERQARRRTKRRSTERSEHGCSKRVQEVPVTPGTTTRLRVQHKTEHIRVEFQRRSDFKVRSPWPTAYPSLRHSVHQVEWVHTWEMLEIESQVPYNANEARIELISSLSGTAWFDGIIFEVIEGQTYP